MATGHLELQRSEFLNSWKDIANYMGRGVRTVQRYESQLGLPVRRPAGRSRSSVIARREDIDNWVAASATRRIGQLSQDNQGCPYCRKSRSVNHNFYATEVQNLVQRNVQLQSALRKSGVDFLKVDLDAAMTFARIALETCRVETRERNRHHARKGYNAVVALMLKLNPSPADAAILQQQLDLLKEELMKLGEQF